MVLLRLRLWLIAGLAVAAVAGCGDDGDDSTSAVSPTTQAPDSNTEATAPAVDETSPTEAAEGRDLLFLTDGDGPVSVTVADLYRQRVEEALGVEVRVTQTGRSPSVRLYPDAEGVLALVRDEEYPFSDKVRDAEIIVVQTWPSGTIEDGIFFNTCWDRTPIPETPDPAVYDDPAYWARYVDVLGEIYTEIIELRQGEPTVIIGVDNYNASLATQEAAGIAAECQAFFERWSTAQREVAEANGAVWVSVYDTINGPEHDVDPVEQGYLGATEEMPGLPTSSPNEIGSAMIADALAAAGFESQA